MLFLISLFRLVSFYVIIIFLCWVLQKGIGTIDIISMAELCVYNIGKLLLRQRPKTFIRSAFFTVRNTLL